MNDAALEGSIRAVRDTVADWIQIDMHHCGQYAGFAVVAPDAPDANLDSHRVACSTSGNAVRSTTPNSVGLRSGHPLCSPPAGTYV